MKQLQTNNFKPQTYDKKCLFFGILSVFFHLFVRPSTESRLPMDLMEMRTRESGLLQAFRSF